MSPAADSAGQPFAGRSFSPHPFQGDTGEEDPGLAAARLELESTLAMDPTKRTTAELSRAWVGVVDALRTTRLLSPLLAEAGDFGVTDTGAVVEKTQELAVIHVEGPDGRAVAPVFSSVARMAAWNPQARPVPVEAIRVALATAADGLELLVVDPGSDQQFVVRHSALEAIATQAEYLPPWSNPQVLDAIAEALQAPGSPVSRHRVVPGDPTHTLAGPELVVVVGVKPGLAAEDLRTQLGQISETWSANPVLARLVDGLGIRVLPD